MSCKLSIWRSTIGLQLLLLLLFVQCISHVAHGQTSSSCISSTNDLEALESAVTDYSVERQYILCPETTFSIGRLDFYGTLISSTGSDMIHLRPNLHLQCGETGESTNNCIISGGSVQLDGTGFRKNVTSLENVVITGLTFTNTLQSNVWIDRMGSVLFRDCIFQGITDAAVPILLDYYSRSAPETKLVVTFEQCEFTDIVYFGLPSRPTVIEGNSKQNHIIILDSTFLRNDLEFNNTNLAQESFLIETSGPLELNRSCFYHNSIGVAPVVVYSSSLVANDNFQYNSTGGVCQFSAQFTASSYIAFTPVCASFDSPQCQARTGTFNTTPPVATPAPTMPPVASTFSPTAAPVLNSTTEPVVSPTVNDTSASPTLAPEPSTPAGPTAVAVPTLSNTTNTTADAPTPDLNFNSTSTAVSGRFSLLLVVSAVGLTVLCL